MSCNKKKRILTEKNAQKTESLFSSGEMKNEINII